MIDDGVKVGGRGVGNGGGRRRHWVEAHLAGILVFSRAMVMMVHGGEERE